MNQATWTAVDGYLAEQLLPPDPILEEALAACAAAGLPAINVTPNQGALLQILARLAGAGRILEIGTLGGYSTIWLARALPPEGRMVTLEVEPAHARVAAANLERAGLGSVVEVRLGPAAQSLARLVDERAEPFDLTFIDADKPSTPEYLEWAVRLSRQGSLIVVDNVVRAGAVADRMSQDPSVKGVQRTLELMAGLGLTATAIQTVGSKGYDGLALGIVA